MSLAKRDGKKDVAYFINSAVCLLIMFGFGQLPAVEPITHLGMTVIGIFLGLLYGWIFIGIIWPSLAGLLALMLVGGMAPVKLLNSSFGDPIVTMMFFIFIFCATINYYGLSKWITLKCITIKFVTGRPWAFTLVFLLSIFLLGALTSASPAAIIGWSILYAVCDLCGYKKGDAYPTMMVFGTVFAAQVGMSIIPFKQVPLAVLGAYQNMTGLTLNYGSYMVLASVICISCALVFILIGKYVYKPDMSKLEHLDANKLAEGESLNLTKHQKAVLVFLIALVVMLLIPGFLPATNPIAAFLKAIGNTGVCILLVTVMCFLKIDGKSLLPFKKMVDDGIQWGIILLLAVVQPLSTLMTSADSGITPALMNLLGPIFMGKSPAFFIVVIGLIAAVVTNFMNNGAIGIALMPFVYTYCTASGIDPSMSVFIVVMSVHLAFLTPAASSSAALLHGNEWGNTKAIWSTSPLVILSSWAVITVITLTLGNLLF